MKEGMHDLMGKYLSGDITPSETNALMDWVDADESNKEEFLAVKELWQTSGETKFPSFNTDAAWVKLNQQLTPAKTKAKLFTIGRLAVGVAAAFIIVLSVWLLGKGEMNSVTASAPVEKILLADGSVIYLRNGSTLNYPSKFKGDERNVTLDGEAFFEVAHDNRHPFIIRSGTANVRVVGTSFSVIEKDQQVQLVVKTGKVRFYDRADTSRQLLVVAGERALLEKGAITKEVNADVNFNAWQTRQLVFNNTPLAEVVNTLRDYYRVDITLRPSDRQQLSNSQITASFNDQPVEAVMKELALIGDLHVEENKGAYEIQLK
jgi:ferric-dicitrate binding protein FerR (iron transport regulator)